jgi:hypothetical protein
VRAYYRARQRLPETTRHLWGAGAYAVSRAGHDRFAAFPDLVADDLFVDALFEPGEKAVVDTEPVVVRTPRDLRSLLAVLRRTYSGNAELGAAALPAVHAPATTGRTVREVVTSATTLPRAVDAAVYTALVVLGRLPSGQPAGVWERDDSSREGTAA